MAVEKTQEVPKLSAADVVNGMLISVAVLELMVEKGIVAEEEVKAKLESLTSELTKEKEAAPVGS
jgi:hypothetical protein